MMHIEAESVTQVILSIKKTLEIQYRDLTIQGEISNLSLSSAGHYYFTLSDESSGISCALFKMDAFRNPAIRKIKNGDKVLLRGPIGLYAKKGTFQIICKKIIPYGKGDLKAQFEFLKEKLRSEGLFSDENKKDIPRFPKKIALITALRGAALQDFLNIMKRRAMWFNIMIIPCVVQGDNCSRSVMKALDKAEKTKSVDVVVIMRGGGSMEDLWGFNNEELVRKVYAYKIPIISAIGHQVDNSLVDFVSDHRCETPSSAAELLSQEQTQMDLRLENCGKQTKLLFYKFKTTLLARLETINPLQTLYKLQQKFRKHEMKLEKLNIFLREDLCRVKEKQQYTDELIDKSVLLIKKNQEEKEQKLSLNYKLIQSLGPRNILKRGFTYLSSESIGVISTLSELEKVDKEDILNVHFSDGKGQVQRLVK